MTYELHVEDTGGGAPVVLLHSSGMSGRQWRRLASDLTARGLRAVVPDLTGHGKSPPWPEPEAFTYRDDVERVAALVASIGSPVHLVGHSYGGLVALLVARASPARVRSLTVYDPVAFGALERVTDGDARGDLDRVSMAWDASPGSHERWLEAFVNYWGGDGAWGALRDDAREEFRRVGWVVYEGVSTLVHDETPAAAYRVVGAPALLLSGERTPLAARRVVQRLGEALPDARVVTVTDAGHMGPLTHMGAVNEAIVRFITSTTREAA